MMFEPKIKKYQKKFDYSYAFGTYPVLELLEKRREKIIKLLIKSNTQGSEGVDEILEKSKAYGIKVEVADRAIEKIAVKENTYVVGIFEKYENDLEKEKNHIVLVEPRNMGNIGTIIRTMIGFNFKNLVLVGNSVDIFDPRVVRSTMGALFSINFKHYEDIREYMSEFKNHNLYPFMLDGAKDIREVDFKEPYSLIQGNESKGLPSEYIGFGQSVYIPHGEEIDSLNLSVATSIGMWEVSRRK